MYYLTPEGFSEKSKLVLEYVTDSLSLFRSLRRVKHYFHLQQKMKFILYGTSEISEIAILSANEVGSEIIGIIEPTLNKKKFLIFLF